jgi:hypothetical protein
MVAMMTVALLLPGQFRVSATPLAVQDQAAQTSATIPPDQLDSLVAPIALYPDKLLAQTLVAATYPLELIQLQQWLAKNPELAKDQKKLADAVKETTLGSEHSGDGGFAGSRQVPC